MKVLVAPDKFKGSLSAIEAAEAIARGWRKVWPGAEIDLAPIADGGEGFAATLQTAMEGQWVITRAHDPLGREVDARYAWIEDQKLAVIDMSEASGLWRLKPDELNPLQASTFGTGELIRDAAVRGAKTILIGLGGSATTDGGVGMAAALGYSFLARDGTALAPLPAHFLEIASIRSAHVIALPEIIAACDVENPLLGPRGTAAVFSPQKGATKTHVDLLEHSLENLARVVASDLKCDFRETAGAGAAGGLGFGLLSFCKASIRSGFEVVAEKIGLEKRICASDLVITGEGRLDEQTLEGKGPAGVAALAHRHGKPALAFAGSISADPKLGLRFTISYPIIDQAVLLPEAMERAGEFLERAAHRAAQLVQLGQVL